MKYISFNEPWMLKDLCKPCLVLFQRSMQGIAPSVRFAREERGVESTVRSWVAGSFVVLQIALQSMKHRSGQTWSSGSG